MLQNKAFTCNRVLIRNSQDINIVTEISCNSVLDADGLVDGHIIMFQDITARTLNEQRLIKLAKYDVLTGLSNRSKFHDFTEGKITYCAHNNKNWPYCLSILTTLKILMTAWAMTPEMSS